MDRLAPMRCAKWPAARQRLRPDAEIGGGEVSSRSLREMLATNCGLMHRAIASIGQMAFRACQRHIERISNWRGLVSRWSDQNGQPGVGLGAVRDELAAPSWAPLSPRIAPKHIVVGMPCCAVQQNRPVNVCWGS